MRRIAALFLLLSALWGGGEAAEGPPTLTLGPPTGEELRSLAGMNLHEASEVAVFPTGTPFRVTVRPSSAEDLERLDRIMQRLPPESQLLLCLGNPVGDPRMAVELVGKCRSRAKLMGVEIGMDCNLHFPEAQSFWPGYRKLALELKQAFPELKVGGPSLRRDKSDPASLPWLEEFLDRVKETSTPLDFVSWQMQALDPKIPGEGAQQLQSLLRAKKMNPPLYCTYYNTHIGRCGELYSLRSTIAGAAAMNDFRLALGRAGVTEAFSGSVSQSAASAFTLWSRWSRYRQRRQILGVAAPIQAWAACDPAGSALLLANPSGEQRLVRLGGGAGKADLWVTSDSAPSIHRVEAELDRPLPLPPQSLILVLLK